MPVVLSPRAWFLSSQERGNPHAELYAGVAGGAAWASGNRVTPLVDGAAYFTRLCAELRTAGPGDWVLFADWRGDPDEQLDGPGSAVMVELARAESAGAQVLGLVWRSHLDRFRFSEPADDQADHAAVQGVDVRGDLVSDDRKLGQCRMQALPSDDAVDKHRRR
jgi:hypothetical protein